MAIKPNDYRVRPGKKVHLKKWPTRVTGTGKSERGSGKSKRSSRVPRSDFRLPRSAYDKKHAELTKAQ